MIQELFSWLDAQRITYIPVDTEVVDIPGFGRLFTADLSGVESIFRGDGDKLVFNLMESPDVLMEEGIFHVAFPFGRNWYYYDLREEFRFNLLKYIGRPKPPVHDVPFVNLGIHTSYELLNACCSPEDLCRKAKWLGHTAVGICDRNTMAATLNLQKECANTGLKHIFGYSLTMMHEEERVGLKIYALDNEGLHNLLRIQRAVMVDSEDNTLRYEQLLMYAAGCVVVFAIRSVYWMAGHPKQVKRIRKGAELEGELVAGPNNFKVLKASPYVITMNLTNAGKYSYSMVETTIELSSAEMALPGSYQGWDATKDDCYKVQSAARDFIYTGTFYFDADTKFKFWDAGVWIGMMGPISWDEAKNIGTFVLMPSDGDNIKIETAGYYRVGADMKKLTASLTKTGWEIIGDATPGGWDKGTVMNYDPATKLWSVDVTLVAGEMKFRWDGAWTVNLGGSLGALTQDGANMKVTAGAYTIVLNPDAKTATMTKK